MGPQESTWIKNKYFAFGWLLSLFLIIFLINPRLITHDPVLDRDDSFLIDPLLNMHSVGDYWQALEQKKIIDRQPLRDLSYFANILLQRKTGFAGYHLLNLLLWIGLFWVLLKIHAYVFGPPDKVSYLLLTLLALHPSLLTSVFWISGRKHLLAAFFILLATWSCFLLAKNQKRLHLWQLFLAYSCSLWSQPIMLFWPIWVLLFLRFKQISWKKILIWGIAPLFMMIACAIINYLYYTGDYVLDNEIPKIMTNNESYLWFSILGMARSFYQIFFPTTLAADYGVGSWQNLAGIPLMVLFIAFCWKKIGKISVLYFVFMIFPLITIYTKATNVFVNDTYLIIFGIGIFVLIKVLFEQGVFNFSLPPWTGTLLFSFMALLYLVQNSGWSRAWESDDDLWEYSYHNEKSVSAMLNYGHMIKDKNFLLAFELILNLKEMAPNHPFFPYVYANVIHAIPTTYLSLDKKMTLLQSSPNQKSYIAYVQGVYLTGKKDWIPAIDLMIRGVITNLSYKDDLNDFIPSFEFVCKQAASLPRTPAAVASVQKCQEFLKKLQDQVKNINDANYQERYLRRKETIARMKALF